MKNGVICLLGAFAIGATTVAACAAPRPIAADTAPSAATVSPTVAPTAAASGGAQASSGSTAAAETPATATATPSAGTPTPQTPTNLAVKTDTGGKLTSSPAPTPEKTPEAVSTAPGGLRTFVHDDSEHGVKFTVKFPEPWAKKQFLATDADATHEASPDSCLQFYFSQDKSDLLTIGAMRFTPPDFGTDNGEPAPFVSANGYSGTKYSGGGGGRVSVFYQFDSDSDAPPYFFAVVNMASETYEQHKKDIEKTVMSLLL